MCLQDIGAYRPVSCPSARRSCNLSGGRGIGPCAAPALNQTGEPSGKSNLPSEVRIPSTSAATSAGGSRTSIICNQSILAFAPFLFSVEMVFRIRITVFGGSLPSDPSGKVNFMNEFGVVTLVAALCSMPLAADGAIWPEAAGEVAARYRPKGKTQPKMANKRFMDMCSQLTQDTGHSEGAVAIMLVLYDDAKREYAYGPAEGLPRHTQNLCDEAKKDGWIVISMKNDWKHIFGFDCAR